MVGQSDGQSVFWRTLDLFDRISLAWLNSLECLISYLYGEGSVRRF